MTLLSANADYFFPRAPILAPFERASAQAGSLLLMQMWSIWTVPFSATDLLPEVTAQCINVYCLVLPVCQSVAVLCFVVHQRSRTIAERGAQSSMRWELSCSRYHCGWIVVPLRDSNRGAWPGGCRTPPRACRRIRRARGEEGASRTASPWSVGPANSTGGSLVAPNPPTGQAAAAPRGLKPEVPFATLPPRSGSERGASCAGCNSALRVRPGS